MLWHSSSAAQGVGVFLTANGLEDVEAARLGERPGNAREIAFAQAGLGLSGALLVLAMAQT
jgi:hypothetical protein